jgi:hypothetical protein
MNVLFLLMPAWALLGLDSQDAASVAKSEIGAKYSQYDRAINLNDAKLLSDYYAYETLPSYKVEIKKRPTRTRAQIVEELSARAKAGKRAFDVATVKGHRTVIKQLRLGDGLAVVKTEEKTATVRQENSQSVATPNKVYEVTVTTKMEIWYSTAFGWKLENTRVLNRASVGTYISDKKPVRKTRNAR